MKLALRSISTPEGADEAIIVLGDEEGGEHHLHVDCDEMTNLVEMVSLAIRTLDSRNRVGTRTHEVAAIAVQVPIADESLVLDIRFSEYGHLAFDMPRTTALAVERDIRQALQQPPRQLQ